MQTPRDKVTEICHKIQADTIKDLLIRATNNGKEYVIPNDIAEKLRLKAISEYKNLSKPYKSFLSAYADRIISAVKSTKKDPPDARIKRLIEVFTEYCNNMKGFKPEINFTAEGSMIKKKLVTYSEEDIKDEFDWFLGSEYSKKFGCTIKTALGNFVFNKWLETR